MCDKTINLLVLIKLKIVVR